VSASENGALSNKFPRTVEGIDEVEQWDFFDSVDRWKFDVRCTVEAFLNDHVAVGVDAEEDAYDMSLRTSVEVL
jgi:hypothetical protein